MAALIFCSILSLFPAFSSLMASSIFVDHVFFVATLVSLVGLGFA